MMIIAKFLILLTTEPHASGLSSFERGLCALRDQTRLQLGHVRHSDQHEPSHRTGKLRQVGEEHLHASINQLQQERHVAGEAI